MRTPVLVAVAALVFAAGSACKRPASGAVGVPSDDVRTAVLVAFPEWRGVRIQHAVVRLEREVPKGVAQPAGHSVKSPFLFRELHQDGRRRWVVELPVGEQELATFALSAAPLTSDDFARMFPRRDTSGATTWVFETTYEAPTSRSDFLIIQLGQGLAGAGFRKTGGELPTGELERVNVTFEHPERHTRVHVQRTGDIVTHRYEQPIRR